MTGQTREAMEQELRRLQVKLEERKASIPIHSVRAHQLIEIEELEEAVEALRQKLAQP